MDSLRRSLKRFVAAFTVSVSSLLAPLSLVWAADGPQPRNDLQSFLWNTSSASYVDASGQKIAAVDLYDKVVAIGFFNTQCSAPCALRVLDLAKVAKALPEAVRDRVAILALSGDPAHDRVSDLKAFSAGMGLAPRTVTLARADVPTMRDIYRSIHWQQGPNSPDDVPPTIFVFDRIGQSAMRYDGSPLNQPRLAHDLAELVTFSHGVGHPPDAASIKP